MPKSHKVNISDVLDNYKKSLEHALRMLHEAHAKLEEGVQGEEKLRCLFTINEYHPRAVDLKGKLAWARRQKQICDYHDFKEKHLRENEDGSLTLVYNPFKSALEG